MSPSRAFRTPDYSTGSEAPIEHFSALNQRSTASSSQEPTLPDLSSTGGNPGKETVGVIPENTTMSDHERTTMADYERRSELK